MIARGKQTVEEIAEYAVKKMAEQACADIEMSLSTAINIKP